MLQLVTTAKFRKDYKRIKRRGYDLTLLQNVLELLLKEETLDPKYRELESLQFQRLQAFLLP